jgi:hypothetical protein
MKTIEERYSFLIKYLKIVDVDFWEGDGCLEMKPLYFQFAEADVDKIDDIGTVIDYAIAAKEWDERNEEFERVNNLVDGNDI